MTTRRATAIAGALAWTLASLVSAAEPQKLRFTDGPAVLDELRPDNYMAHMLAGEDASETWDYAFRFPSTGYILFAQFMITNIGPGDLRCAGLGWIIDPKGKTTLLKNSRQRDEWKLGTSDDRLEISIASHTLSVTPKQHHVHMEHHKLGGFDLNAEPLTPAVRIGRIDYGDGAYYDATMIAPRLHAKGSLTQPDKSVVDLGEGVGTAVYSRTNHAERKRMVSSLRYDTFEGKTQLSLFELTTPEEFKYQRLAAMIVIRDGEIDSRLLEFKRAFIDLEREKEDPRYPVPKGFTVEASGKGLNLSGGIDLTLLRRDDILLFVKSGVTRFLAKIKLQSRPIGYRFLGKSQIKLVEGDETTVITGVGLATLSTIKDPPTDW